MVDLNGYEAMNLITKHYRMQTRKELRVSLHNIQGCLTNLNSESIFALRVGIEPTTHW